MGAPVTLLCAAQCPRTCCTNRPRRFLLAPVASPASRAACVTPAVPHAASSYESAQMGCPAASFLWVPSGLTAGVHEAGCVWTELMSIGAQLLLPEPLSVVAMRRFCGSGILSAASQSAFALKSCFVVEIRSRSYARRCPSMYGNRHARELAEL